MTNMTNFGPEFLEQLFTTDFIEKARAYHQKSKVMDLTINGNMITGSIKNSSEIYRVALFFKRNGMKSRCSCNSKGLCIHSAVIFLDAMMEMNTNPLERLEHAVADEWDVKEEFLPVRYDKHFYSFEHRLMDTFKTKHKSITPGEKRYKLAFTVIDSFERLQIKAIMVYIRKNGEYGSAVPYSKEKVTEPVTEEEQTLLTSLLMGKQVVPESDLTGRLHFLIHNRVFLYGLHSSQPISIKRIFFIEIHFKLENPSLHEDFTFTPFFRLYDEKKGLLADMVSKHRLYTENGYLYVYDNANNILYYRFDYSLCNIIGAIKNLADFYYPADIRTISEYLDENISDRCTISFPYEHIKVTTPRPEIILKINPSSGFMGELGMNQNISGPGKRGAKNKVYITFCFSYDNVEVDYNYAKKIIVDPVSIYKPELILIKRNKEYEEKCVNIIIAFLSPITMEIYEGRWFPESGLVLAGTIESFLKDFGLALIDRGVSIKIKNKKLSSRVLLTFKVETGIDWFDIYTIALDKNGNTNDIIIDPGLLPRGIIQAGDDYVFISREDVEKLTRLRAGGMGKDGKMKAHKANFFLLETIYTQVANKEDEFEKYASIGNKLKAFNKMEHQEQPAGFTGTLRDYQKAGYDWLYFLFSCSINACLADDMGLGKTIQALCLLQKLKEHHKFYTTLLVIPVVTFSNWEHEIERFTPGMSVIRHAGSRRTKEIGLLMEHDLILVSYPTLRIDIELFSQEKYFCIILDESQYVKNAATKTFKAIRLLKAEHILSLTGTPIENNLFELWAQMNILNPGLLGSIDDFQMMFINPMERSKDGGIKEKEYLRKITYPFILRRKKTDVLKDLPSKEVIIHYSEMGTHQKRIYETIKAFYRQKIQRIMAERIPGKGNQIDIFAAILKVRQIALFPDLVSEEYKNVESCKFESAKLLIDEICAENHKILIFSQFVQVINRFKAYFNNQGYTYSCITGQTRKRDIEIEKFQNDKDINIFLLSLKAGGTGINLTAADYVIIYDPWWNPAVEQQAMDRSHRIGQTEKVTVYKMIVKDTIEEKMLKLQENKQKMVDEVITSEKGLYKSFSTVDIEELFG